MIRRVAFKKAVIAGALGALAWEIVIRGLIAAGVPMFDLVHTLGSMALGGEPDVWQWWPVGMAMHAMVGAIWAVFYAYFLWSMFDQPPVVQGMIFAILPAILAGLIMVPQMDQMRWRPHGGGTVNGFFAIGFGWLGPVTIVGGHLIYGAVMGALYTRPVGFAVGEKAPGYG